MHAFAAIALPLLAAASLATAAPTTTAAGRDPSTLQAVLAAPKASSGGLDNAGLLPVASPATCPKGFTPGSVSHSATIPTTVADIGRSPFLSLSHHLL